MTDDKVSPIIKWARENYATCNGMNQKIGWYLCVPMKVLAEALGMKLDEFVDATAYYKEAWKNDSE